MPFTREIIIFLTMIFLLIVTVSVQTEAATGLIKSDDFSGSSVSTSNWKVYNNNTIDTSKAIYMSRNVSVANGYLTIRTQRHCVKGNYTYKSVPKSSINDSTVRSSPCPSGYGTFYSSGRVDSKFRTEPGQYEFRAKQPAIDGQMGWWGAIWFRNQASWCSTNYGELDLLENYSDAPKQSTATSHMGCSGGSTTKRQHYTTLSGPVSNNWHTWLMDFDTDSILYKFDGKAIPASKGGSATDTPSNVDISTAKFRTIVDDTWKTRIEVQVHKGDKWHDAPNDNATFKTMEFKVDYAKYYASSATIPDAGNPPPDTTNSTSSSTGSNSTTNQVVPIVNIDDPALTSCTDSDCGLFEKYINPLVAFLAAFVGIAVTVGIIKGGIQYASSGSDPASVTSAKSQIKGSIIALIVYLFLLAILQWLQPGGLL